MRVGDLVTRRKYNHDIVFRIRAIKDRVAILEGEVIRLKADAPLDDLVIASIVEKDDNILENELFVRNDDSALIKVGSYILMETSDI